MTSWSRKVQPIYEALDARNPKQALKLCDAVLKKSSIPLVRALKAVSLERTGRTEDAIVLARGEASAAVKAPPVDESVLSTLNIVFRAVGLIDEGTTAYEAACQIEPGNTELASQLFSAYLRSGAFAKAQMLAMKMFKQPNGEEYLFWAVTCLLLQVDEMSPPVQPSASFADAAAPPAAAKHLQLAAAMLGRADGQGKVCRPSHISLFLEVLRRQQAHAERLKLLESRSGLIGAPVDVLRFQAELHERMGDHASAIKVHSTLLLEHTPDAWSTLAAALRCALHDCGEGSKPCGKADLVASTRKLVTGLQATHPKARGPWLAEIALQLYACDRAAALRMLGAAHGDISKDSASCSVPNKPIQTEQQTGLQLSQQVQPLVNLLVSYFDKYGERAFCTLDTSPCLNAFVAWPAAQHELLGRLSGSMEPDSLPTELSLSWLQRFITLCNWRVACGSTREKPIEEVRRNLAHAQIETSPHGMHATLLSRSMHPPHHAASHLMHYVGVFGQCCPPINQPCYHMYLSLP